MFPGNMEIEKPVSAQDNLGFKKGSAPWKISQNAPLYFLPGEKNNILDFQNQWFINSLKKFHLH